MPNEVLQVIMVAYRGVASSVDSMKQAMPMPEPHWDILSCLVLRSACTLVMFQILMV